MADSIESVNAAARLYRKWATEPDDKVTDATRAYWGLQADGLEAAAAEIIRWRTWAKPLPAAYGDISDLPPELMAQLSGIKTDELEDQIYAIVKAAGDEIELDRLLIELYRRHGDVHQRRFLNNKLWRMGQKGLIYSIKGRKGVYTIIPQAGPAELEDTPEDEAQGGFGVAPPTRPDKTSFAPDLEDEIDF